MLVDHLADAITQQHDELIERIDLPLQLDAIHEIDRDGHLLLAQRIQKRVLKRLTLGHFLLSWFFLFACSYLMARPARTVSHRPAVLPENLELRLLCRNGDSLSPTTGNAITA